MIIIVVSVCPFRSILDQSLILPAHWTVSRVETRRLLVVVVKALAMADMCTDAEGVCSSECMSACWTSALTGGAPPCLHDCADSNALIAAVVVALPYVCRAVDALMDKLAPAEGGKKAKKGKKGKQGDYEAMEKGKKKDDAGFTMKKLAETEENEWDEAVDEWDGPPAAVVAVGRLLFCHIAQPLIYLVLFSLARPNLSGISLYCGWCVAVRELGYLAATLGCVAVNRAFLLIDVPASVGDTSSDHQLHGGPSFLAAYVAAPHSIVLSVLLAQEEIVVFVLAGGFALDICAIAALGGAVGGGTVPVFLMVFYAASAAGGALASVVSFEDDSKRGGAYAGLIAVALGGGFAIGSGKIELASGPTAGLLAVALGLGYVVLQMAIDDSDDDDSDDDSDDDDAEDDDENSSNDDDDDDDDDDDGKKYKVFDEIEVFSKSANRWCEGEVKAVYAGAGTVKTEYKSATSGALMQKVLMVESPDLRKVETKSGRSRSNSGSSGSKSPKKKATSRARSASTAGRSDRELKKKEEDGEFRYEVRAEFDKKDKGSIGFKFDDEHDEIVVKTIKKKTPASDIEHACEGMILRRYQIKKRSTTWAKEKDADKEDYDDMIDIIKKERPVRLFFEYPWQYVPGKRKVQGHWNNWYTEEDEDDRPEELLDVYDTMKGWDGGEGGDDDPYGNGSSTMMRTSTQAKHLCNVKGTKQTGTFNVRTHYTLSCTWNGFDGESEHTYTDLAAMDKDIRQHVLLENRDELPTIPQSGGASDDKLVIRERKRWIEEYFVLAFHLLDERMKQRKTYASGDNRWDTTFCTKKCVLAIARALTVACVC